MKEILITGGAGFIGSNLVDTLLKESDYKITILDNFDPFYDPLVKKQNIKNHLNKTNLTLIKGDIRCLDRVKSKLSSRYHAIIHLAAKVGVQSSLKDPLLYTEVNVNGTQNMLEFARQVSCKKFIFASSSSVYGVNTRIPWKEEDRNLLPISPYAATKISGELLGHVYAHLYGFQFISLRFFTVYGPRQRPDLAIHKFAKRIVKRQPITMYGDGRSKRDYTYIDDIIMGIKGALDYSKSRYEIINLGNNQPVQLRTLISLLQKALGKKAIIKKLPEQKGDVPKTFADIQKARKLLGYQPKTNLETGLKKFAGWFYENNEKN